MTDSMTSTLWEEFVIICVDYNVTNKHRYMLECMQTYNSRAGTQK